MTNSRFEVHESAAGVPVLRCLGGLSWEDREMLASAVEDLLRPLEDVRGVILDFANVGFINSAGVGALFQLCQRLRKRETTLLLVNLPPGVARLFESVGLDRQARVCRDVSAALATLDPATPSPAHHGINPGKRGGGLVGQFQMQTN